MASIMARGASERTVSRDSSTNGGRDPLLPFPQWTISEKSGRKKINQFAKKIASLFHSVSP